MNARATGILAAVLLVFGLDVSAQENPPALYPRIFWENSMDKGVILASSTEMIFVDSKGVKFRKLSVNDGVEDIYISPDGKKLIYTAASKVWLVEIENGKTHLVANGVCGYLRWNSDSLSFMFTISEYAKDSASAGTNTKFFWADGDGKNLKQVYP